MTKEALILQKPETATKNEDVKEEKNEDKIAQTNNETVKEEKNDEKTAPTKNEDVKEENNEDQRISIPKQIFDVNDFLSDEPNDTTKYFKGKR